MKVKLKRLRWIGVTAVLMLSVCISSKGQFWDSSTGLLQALSADMNQSGALMLTTNFLNKNSIPPR